MVSTSQYRFLAFVTLLLGLVFLAAAIHNMEAASHASPRPKFLPTHSDIRHAVLTPCRTEDSSNCYWDAHKMGDLRGHSLVTVRVGDQDCIIYTDPKYNAEHGHCL